MKTPDYIQVTGLVKQDLINLAANDSGGEMDPHGADQRGNPLGGLLFSKSFNNSTFVQVIEWHKCVANIHLGPAFDSPYPLASWVVAFSV